MTRRVAVVVALAVLTGACVRGDRAASVTTTTSTSTSTSTIALTTTTVPALAPTGCDASQLKRVAPRADRTLYDVSAVLDLDANTVTGTMKASFTPDRATDRIVMRLWPNGPIPAAKGAHENLANPTIDGRPVPMSLPNETTAVIASGELGANRRVELAVSFTLRLPGVSDDRLSR
ncbi:MAG: hypothetical protein QOF21_1129, partial [Actinomycetota bacterium]